MLTTRCVSVVDTCVQRPICPVRHWEWEVIITCTWPAPRDDKDHSSIKHFMKENKLTSRVTSIYYLLLLVLHELNFVRCSQIVSLRTVSLLFGEGDKDLFVEDFDLSREKKVFLKSDHKQKMYGRMRFFVMCMPLHGSLLLTKTAKLIRTCVCLL